jgi:hypothetical protein
VASSVVKGLPHGGSVSTGLEGPSLTNFGHIAEKITRCAAEFFFVSFCLLHNGLLMRIKVLMSFRRRSTDIFDLDSQSRFLFDFSQSKVCSSHGTIWAILSYMF